MDLTHFTPEESILKNCMNSLELSCPNPMQLTYMAFLRTAVAKKKKRHYFSFLDHQCQWPAMRKMEASLILSA